MGAKIVLPLTIIWGLSPVFLSQAQQKGEVIIDPRLHTAGETASARTPYPEWVRVEFKMLVRSAEQDYSASLTADGPFTVSNFELNHRGAATFLGAINTALNTNELRYVSEAMNGVRSQWGDPPFLRVLQRIRENADRFIKNSNDVAYFLRLGAAHTNSVLSQDYYSIQDLAAKKFANQFEDALTLADAFDRTRDERAAEIFFYKALALVKTQEQLKRLDSTLQRNRACRKLWTLSREILESRSRIP